METDIRFTNSTLFTTQKLLFEFLNLLFPADPLVRVDSPPGGTRTTVWEAQVQTIL